MSNGTSHAYSPTRIIPKNGYDFKGSPLLATMGAFGNEQTQFFLLTSQGLYVWGTEGAVIPSSVTNGATFREMPLPKDISARDITYMTASYKVLVLKTKEGKVYTMGIDNKLYGDGSKNSDGQWHIVKLKGE